MSVKEYYYLFHVSSTAQEANNALFLSYLFHYRELTINDVGIWWWLHAIGQLCTFFSAPIQTSNANFSCFTFPVCNVYDMFMDNSDESNLLKLSVLLFCTTYIVFILMITRSTLNIAKKTLWSCSSFNILKAIHFFDSSSLTIFQPFCVLFFGYAYYIIYIIILLISMFNRQLYICLSLLIKRW